MRCCKTKLIYPTPKQATDAVIVLTIVESPCYIIHCRQARFVTGFALLALICTSVPTVESAILASCAAVGPHLLRRVFAARHPA